MVVNAKGRAVTQRVEPSLALVEVHMPPEAFAEDWQPNPDPNSNSHMMGTIYTFCLSISNSNYRRNLFVLLFHGYTNIDDPSYSLRSARSCESTRNGPAEDPSCCPTHHDRWRHCLGVVWLCIRRRRWSSRMVFRLLGEAEPASAFQTRFSQSKPALLPSLLPSWVYSTGLHQQSSAFHSVQVQQNNLPLTWCRISFFTASETRPTNPDYAQGYKVMFTDGFPILIASQVVFVHCSDFQCFPGKWSLCANVVIVKHHKYIFFKKRKKLQIFSWQCTFDALVAAGFTGCAKRDS